MKDAAVNRLAKSITQLTLCQITPVKLMLPPNCLTKHARSFRHPKHPSQRVTDLEAAIRQLRQIKCILDSCTISASYEVSQAQKALLLLPHTAKGQAHHRKSSMHKYRHALTMSIIFHDEDYLQEQWFTRTDTTNTKTTKRRRGRFCYYTMVLVEASISHRHIHEYLSMNSYENFWRSEQKFYTVSVRSDILKQMFDFYDQISASRHYPSLEQTNLQATAGVPSAERNALSGNVAAGTAARAVTARRMSLSLTS